MDQWLGFVGKVKRDHILNEIRWTAAASGARHKNGEGFELSAGDVAASKRGKFMWVAAMHS